MPTFFSFDGCKVDLYFNEHPPPHFHVLYAEYEVLIEIATLSVFKGSLPPKQLHKVLKWAADHQADLMEIWNQLRAT